MENNPVGNGVRKRKFLENDLEGGIMGTFVVGLVVVGIVSCSIRSMVRDKRNGKSIQCGGDCKHCGGHCH